ncbi:metallo-beta-lactamase/flavodoxin domain-containing protein [Candidatus Omnitrophus magneticus]|uniref:Metallo-beta-lactamase/flavodoxin domain-containing protein n=1 Tax=Candidatus Omnitrophus magneticus TaxID=1609969 RepID=A0A0F0CVG6_9BACT|nr:metallo-beta-lactamase/flavodoxin domain-containing protein [Candidatus Omnitrophus magneticus]
MKAREIKKNIFWVGGIDWDLRNFHGYITPRGTTYNAYLIIDKKIVLVDTVKHYLCDEMIARIKSIVDPEKIDFIVSNHVEMDHSGSLPMITKIAKNSEVITSIHGEKGLLKHYGNSMKLRVVSSGDSFSIGERELEFIHTPMVHWPDSMVTYIAREKLLLPNDAFGQHIAGNERFDDELGWAIVKEESAKYYANIVMPYGKQVSSVLGAISNLDIDMIAPSHGIIWRSHISDIVKCYKKWAENLVDEKAVIIYDTMWGSTKKMALAIVSGFEDSGINAELINLKETDISTTITKLLTAKYIIVGSSTLNSNVLPTVSGFLTYMSGLAPKNRIGMAFGSYGWGGQSVPDIENTLKKCGFSMWESLKAQYIPDEKDLSGIVEKIKNNIISFK